MGPPATERAQMLVVAPSISGSASQLPSGDKLQCTNAGETGRRPASTSPIGVAAPSSGAARQIVQLMLPKRLERVAKYRVPSPTTGACTNPSRTTTASPPSADVLSIRHAVPAGRV